MDRPRRPLLQRVVPIVLSLHPLAILMRYDALPTDVIALNWPSIWTKARSTRQRWRQIRGFGRESDNANAACWDPPHVAPIAYC